MRVTIIIVASLLSACQSLVPAKSPIQLSRTPEAGFSITADQIVTPQFTVDYPDGWRVVKTSIAGDPFAFVMVSPDGDWTISLNVVTACSDAEATRNVCLENRLQFTGQAESGDFRAFSSHFDAVVSSAILRHDH